MTPLQRTLALAVLCSAFPMLAPPVAALAPATFRVPEAVRVAVRTSRIVDVAQANRHRNWGGGSCVHASMVYLFHWQGRHDIGNWWKTKYRGGETPSGLRAKFEAHKYAYAETQSGDVQFLEDATRTRHGAGVVVQNGAHMVDLVGLDATHAHIWDSNAPEKIQARPRDEFLREWKQSGGWAVVPLVGTPEPPRPWIVNQGVRK